MVPSDFSIFQLFGKLLTKNNLGARGGIAFETISNFQKKERTLEKEQEK
jgi:hypothetical protein